MITLIELNHGLAKVGTAELILARYRSPAYSRNLREALKGLIWMLTEEISEPDTPARKEARRQLRMEAAAMLSEIELALHDPTLANHACVAHRAKVWSELVRQVRPTLGIIRGTTSGTHKRDWRRPTFLVR